MEIYKNSRSHPVNSIQKKTLVGFMEKYPDLRSGRFTAELTFKKAQQLWEEIAAILNKIPNGSQKNWRKWRKTWQDLKKHAKSKAKKSRKYSIQTDGGASMVEALEKVDNDILDLMTNTAIGGFPTIKESAVELNFVDKDNPDDGEIIIIERECGDESIVNNIHSDEDIIEQEDTVQLSTYTGNDDVDSLGLPKIRETETNSKKRLTKTRRLTSSLELGHKAANSMNRRTQIFESYYEEKKNYLKHRKNYEINKLKILETHNATNLQILETLKSMKRCSCLK